MRRVLFAACLAAAATLPLSAQQSRVFTHADTLHGSNTPERAWWDAEFYDLHVAVHPADRQHHGVERDHLSGAHARAGDADRSPGAARAGQRGAGPPPARVPPGRQRLLRDPRSAPAEWRAQESSRLLPRRMARQSRRHHAPSRVRPVSLGHRFRQRAMDRHVERRPRRQRVVAAQGLPGRRNPTASASRSPSPTRSSTFPMGGSAPPPTMPAAPRRTNGSSTIPSTSTTWPSTHRRTMSRCATPSPARRGR